MSHTPCFVFCTFVDPCVPKRRSLQSIVPGKPILYIVVPLSRQKILLATDLFGFMLFFFYLFACGGVYIFRANGVGLLSEFGTDLVRFSCFHNRTTQFLVRRPSSHPSLFPLKPDNSNPLTDSVSTLSIMSYARRRGNKVKKGVQFTLMVVGALSLTFFLTYSPFQRRC